MELGGFDPALAVGEDILLWAQLAIRHPRLVYVRTRIATYNWGLEGSLTQQGHPATIEATRRILALGESLPEGRALLLRIFARRRLVVHFKKLLATGQVGAIRAALGAPEVRGLTPSWLVAALVAASRLPGSIVVRAFHLGRRLRRMFRRRRSTA